jgi:hypothetical protein
MKVLQKLILPVLFLGVIYIIYMFYFAPGRFSGAFSDFDTNNNASKDITVEFIKDKGIQHDTRSGISIFYVKDKKGQVVMVQGPLPLPEGVESSSSLTLTGHLHNDFFHAHEIVVN